MKKNILLIGVSILSLAAAVMPLAAQTNTPAPPPAQLDTNLLADLGSNAPAPFKALLNLLPAWDPTLTNTFGSGELFISATPLWKSQTASGSTPYLSTSGGYYATRNLGLEAELVTLGGGNGQSTIDSGAVMGMFRKMLATSPLTDCSGRHEISTPENGAWILAVALPTDIGLASNSSPIRAGAINSETHPKRIVF